MGQDWQRENFEVRFGTSPASVIEIDGARAGGLLLRRTPDAIAVVEIQILPRYQGHSIGTAVLQHIIDEAFRRV